MFLEIQDCGELTVHAKKSLMSMLEFARRLVIVDTSPR